MVFLNYKGNGLIDRISKVKKEDVSTMTITTLPLQNILKLFILKIQEKFTK